MPRTAQRSSLYDVHPGVAMVQNTLAKLKEKTGRDLEEWIAFIKKAGPPTEKERRDWLKKEHGLGTNYAWWLAERTATTFSRRSSRRRAPASTLASPSET